MREVLTGDWIKLRREGTPSWDCVSKLAQAAYLVVLQRADMDTGVLPLPPGDELERLATVVGLGIEPIRELVDVGAVDLEERLARIPESDWNSQQGANSNAQRCKRRRQRIEAHNSDTPATHPDTERHDRDTPATPQEETRREETRVKPLSAKPPVSANDAYFDDAIGALNHERIKLSMGVQRETPNNRKAVSKIRKGEDASLDDWAKVARVFASEIRSYDSKASLGTSPPGAQDPRKFFTLQSLARGDNFSRKLNAPDPSPKSNSGQPQASNAPSYPAPIRTEWQVEQERLAAMDDGPLPASF